MTEKKFYKDAQSKIGSMFFFPMGNLKACHDHDIDQDSEQTRPALGKRITVTPTWSMAVPYRGPVTSFKMNVVMNFIASSADKLSYLNRIQINP